MPPTTINVSGKKYPYSAAQRQEAAEDNREFDARAKQARDLANYENRDLDLRTKKTKSLSKIQKDAADAALAREKRAAKINADRFRDNAQQVYNLARLRQRAAQEEARAESVSSAKERRDAADRMRWNASLARFKERAARGEASATKANQAAAAREFRDNARGVAAVHRMKVNATRQQAREEAVAAKQAERYNPSTYASRGIGGIGATGSSAILNGERGQARGSKRMLNRIERRVLAKMKGATGARREELGGYLSQVNQARAQMGGAEELRGLSSMSGDGAIGELGAAAGAVYEIAKALDSAPGKFASFASTRLNASEPFTGLKYGAAAMGRSNNFGGEGLLRSFYPGNGTVPEWMRRLGLAPADAINIAGASGLPFGSADDAVGAVSAIAGADRMRGLAGLGTDRLGRSLNLANTLGLRVNDPYGGNVGISGNSDLATGSNGTVSKSDAYFRVMSDAVSRGTMMGLDKSQTLGNLEGLFSQAASAGANQVNGSDIASRYLQMAAGGNASARTGQEQANVEAGYSSAIAGMGLGGDNTQAMVLQARTAATGGKLPTTRAGLARYFHMTGQQLDAYGSTASGSAAIDNMLQAGQAGNTLAFGEYARPFLDSNKGTYRQLLDESPLITSMPGYLRPLAGGTAAHMSTQQYYESSPSFSRTTTSMKGSPAERALLDVIGQREGGRNNYHALYGQTQGVDDLSQFPNWSGNMGPAGMSHAAGMYQFQPGTWSAAQKGAGVSDFQPGSQDDAALWLARKTYKDKTGRDLTADLNDPARLPGIRSALSGPWSSLSGSDPSFSSRFGQQLGLEQSRPSGGIASNSTAAEDASRANAGQLAATAGEAENAKNSASLGGDATGGAMLSLSNNVKDVDKWLSQLVNSLQRAIGRLDGIQIAAGSMPARTAPMRPATSP